MNENFIKDLFFDIDTWIRVYVWKFLGIRTVVIKTTSGSMLLRYLREDDQGPYANDMVGRIALFKDFSSDQMYVKHWSWAPWCETNTIELPEKTEIVEDEKPYT